MWTSTSEEAHAKCGTNGIAAGGQALIMLAPSLVAAQYYQTDFPADEFRARHAQVFAKIGDNAVAVVQGVHQTEGFTLPRQHNTFYYLFGIETPGAYLLLDGRTKKVTIYLPPRNQRLEAAEGRVLSADDVELVKRIAGVDDVAPLTAMATAGWPLCSAVAGRRANAAAAAVPRRRRFTPSSARPRTRPSRGELCPPRPRASTTSGMAPCRGRSASSSCCARASLALRCATSTRSSTRCAASRARVRSRCCGARHRSPVSG